MSENGTGGDAGAAAAGLPAHISQNIAEIVELQRRESADLSDAQRRLERVSDHIARPAYFLVLFALVAGWIAFNLLAGRLSLRSPDPPPFAWLQGLLTFVALLTSTIVLIAQRRLDQLSVQRAHLDLQINLLTEQKVTKLIHMLEELRQDSPSLRDRDDPHAAALKERTDAGQVLSALKTSELGSAETPPRGR